MTVTGKNTIEYDPVNKTSVLSKDSKLALITPILLYLTQSSAIKRAANSASTGTGQCAGRLV